MDRKGLIVLIFALLSLLGMNFFASRVLFPPKLVPYTNQPTAGKLTTPLAPGTGTGTAATLNAPSPTAATGAVSAPVSDSQTARRPEQLLALSNAAVQFVFTSHGGGLRQAALLGHTPSFIPAPVRPVSTPTPS